MKIVKECVENYDIAVILIIFLGSFVTLNIDAMNITQMHQNRHWVAAAMKKRVGAVAKIKEAAIKAEPVETAIAERLKGLESSEKAEPVEDAIAKSLKDLKEHEYFVRAVGTSVGEVMLDEALRLSGNLASKVDYLKQFGGKEILLEGYTPEDITILCDALNGNRKKVEDDIKEFPLEKLIKVANMLSYFAIRDKKQNDEDNGEDKEKKDKLENLVLKKIKIEIEDKEGNVDQLEHLTSDLQKSLMAERDIDYLKNIIMQAKKMDHPDAFIKHTMRNVSSLAFSPDGNLVVAGGLDKLILWNTADVNKITPRVLAYSKGRVGAFEALAFSPDGKTIAVGGFDKIVLWDISNLENPIEQLLEDKVGSIKTLTFSHQGDIVAAGSFGYLRLWNINTSKKLLYGDNIEAIQALAFSPDDSKLVLGGVNQLMLGNIKDFDKITFQELWKPANDQDLRIFQQVAFSPDGKKIISNDLEELILWDVKKDNNKITSQVLLKDLGRVISLIFGANGKNISLCCAYRIGKPYRVWFTSDMKYEIQKRVFITLNMSDTEKITLDIDQVVTSLIGDIPAAISLDGNKIVLSHYDQLNLFIFLNDEQKSLINKIKNAESSESISQMRLLYELCLWSFKRRKIKSDRLCELEKRASKLLPLSVLQLFFKDQHYSFCTLW